MGFLSILAAWLLLRWHGPLSALQRDHWLQVWRARAAGLCGALPAGARLLFTCALPCLLVALVAHLLAHWLGGALLFVFGLLVLLYSLGRGDLHARLDAYLERWARGDVEAAYRAAAESVYFDARAPVGDAVELHTQVRKAVLYAALERWFAVVFWFYLLGPAAALFYRMVQWYAQQDGDDAPLLRRWLWWLEWLPARLLGLAFAVCGYFSEGFRAWRAYFASVLPTGDLLALYAQRALGPATAHDGDEQFAERAVVELRELYALLTRSEVSWLVLFALLQLVR